MFWDIFDFYKGVKASVNLENVEKFKDAVEIFTVITIEEWHDMEKTFEEMIEKTKNDANELNNIVVLDKNLYSLIQELKRNLGNQLSSLQADLSVTPKEITYEVENDDGTKTTKTKANPVYQNLQAEYNSVSSRLSQVKDLSWDVYNEISHAERTYNEILSCLRNLEEYYQEIYYEINKMQEKSNYSLETLVKVIEKIVNYTSYNII